jgi:hypothetical protein
MFFFITPSFQRGGRDFLDQKLKKMIQFFKSSQIVWTAIKKLGVNFCDCYLARILQTYSDCEVKSDKPESLYFIKVSCSKYDLIYQISY